MVKQLGLAYKLDGTESLGISKAHTYPNLKETYMKKLLHRSMLIQVVGFIYSKDNSYYMIAL